MNAKGSRCVRPSQKSRFQGPPDRLLGSRAITSLNAIVTHREIFSRPRIMAAAAADVFVVVVTVT